MHALYTVGMQLLNLALPQINQLPQACKELQLETAFFAPMHAAILQKVNFQSPVFPHIDFDSLKVEVKLILDNLNELQIRKLRTFAKSTIAATEWKKAPENKSLMVFLSVFPAMANLISNVHLLAPIAIASAEIHLGISINTANFIQAKQFIDRLNRERWTRQQTDNEQQAGVSNLGGVSETLLEMAMENLIDQTNFFKISNQKVQSYGDFVLMCLPNNLWLSVKSNFARERLLASGYTTDILGVGFFTSKDEFTSKSKIRNFQRVGFLAMYLPDVPVSEEQVANNTNTFTEVTEYYHSHQISMPLNINGTPFIRSLSNLHNDVSQILAISDISNRTTLDF
jgi:hypothetical protein